MHNPHPASLRLPLREPTVKEGLWLAFFSALAYAVTYSANIYVVRAQEAFVGVAMFFLPAGVKLVAIMLARYWAALGLLCVNFVHTLSFWNGLDWWQMVGVSVVWVGSTLLVVVVMSRLFNLQPDLKGLRFGQFVWLSLVAALFHGLAFNGYMVAIGIRRASEWLGSAKAMALGDFLGSGAVMLMLLVAFKLVQFARRRSRQSS
jgi:hypothetical protein